MHYLLRDLNKDEKPREKLSKMEVSALTNEELIALVLRSGGKGVSAIDVAREILKKFGGISGLALADLQQLQQIKFIDIAKAAGLIAAVEIGLRVIERTGDENKVKIEKPQDVLRVLQKDLFKQAKEKLYLISLDSRNKMVAKDLLSVGTVNETLLSPREIFKQALLRNAVGIILVHNHPSGDPTPSAEDIEITRNLLEAAQKMQIKLIDHVVLSNNSFVSIKNLILKGGDKHEYSKTKGY